MRYRRRIHFAIKRYAEDFFVSLERREIYFMAIIDVLTQYGVKKQVSKRFDWRFWRIMTESLSVAGG